MFLVSQAVSLQILERQIVNLTCFCIFMSISVKGFANSVQAPAKKKADINIFSVASGHLYERFLSIMMLSVMKNTESRVKFWFIENFLSPSFKVIALASLL